MEQTQLKADIADWQKRADEAMLVEAEPQELLLLKHNLLNEAITLLLRASESL